MRMFHARLKPLVLLVALLGLAACAGTPDTVMRNAPFVSPEEAEALAEAPRPSVFISEAQVEVPRSLRVSERNTYYPGTDIVWRGDEPGDRHAQVKAIFEASIARSQQVIAGQRPAVLHVEVHRFHSLTERARYTVGGVHSIEFSWYLADAETGLALTLPERVRANLRAFGGAAAIAAQAHGDTQKVRVTRHLTRVFIDEIMTTDGWTQASYGLFDLVNEF
jgi:uncharacterized lipoprotein YmbA